MDYVSGGFRLVRGFPRAEWMAATLPSTLWTISGCICDTLPDSWALSWSQDAPEVLAEARQLLGLTSGEFATMREYVEQLYVDGRFGWPDVFLDLAAAREFRRKYCRGVRGVRLLGIALATPLVEQFLIDATPFKSQEEPGVFRAVSARRPPPHDGSIRGFEVLGYEDHGGFHSFVCNGLEREYASLGIRLNEFGLMDDFADAERADEFTNLESTGAEPVPWEAWRIDEYDADEVVA